MLKNMLAQSRKAYALTGEYHLQDKNRYVQCFFEITVNCMPVEVTVDGMVENNEDTYSRKLDIRF
jgi:hypothetical protein